MHNAGIFPVLYEGKTEEKNSFEGQNEGDEIDFDYLINNKLEEGYYI